MKRSIPFIAPFLLLVVLATTSCTRPLPVNTAEFPPQSVPARTIQFTDNVSTLWIKEIELQNPHKVYVEFFTPDEQTLVFWHPEGSLLTALDVITGSTVWETPVPDISVLRLHDQKFFILSYEWRDTLDNAPVLGNQPLPDCSFAGDTSLLTYDPYTGEQIWGYVYNGVDPDDIFFENDAVYLDGSGDHGASRSIARIDSHSGELLSLECNKWPGNAEIPLPPDNEGIISNPYRVILNEQDFASSNVLLSFEAINNRLTILNGQSRVTVGYIDFAGAELNPWDINVAVQNGIAVIYFDDSNQLMALRLNQND